MKLYRVATEAGPRWARQKVATLKLLDGDPWAGLGETPDRVDLDQATLLVPARPGEIVGVGLNDRDHAEERGREIPTEPLLFLKPPSALLAPGRPIPLPAGVGRRARRLGSREEADEQPGDIIATGAPAGIGPLAPGDEVGVEVEGVGVLRNPVAPQSEV